MARPLSPKQEMFVKEYLVDLNATQAAKRAGYNAKTAYSQGQRLLKKVEIQSAIAAAQQDRAKRVEISQDYVLSNLTEIVERTMQRAPVCNMKGEQVQDDEGNNLWEFDAKSANRALELLGKHLGLFTDKVQQEVSGPGGGPVEQKFVVEFVRPVTK